MSKVRKGYEYDPKTKRHEPKIRKEIEEALKFLNFSRVTNSTTDYDDFMRFKKLRLQREAALSVLDKAKGLNGSVLDIIYALLGSR